MHRAVRTSAAKLPAIERFFLRTQSDTSTNLDLFSPRWNSSPTLEMHLDGGCLCTFVC